MEHGINKVRLLEDFVKKRSSLTLKDKSKRVINSEKSSKEKYMANFLKDLIFSSCCCYFHVIFLSYESSN